MKIARNKTRATLVLTNTKQFRRDAGMNQTAFWTRYGITQSGGSRYESGRDMPKSTAILLVLHAMGTVSDDDLKLASTMVDQAVQA